MSYPKTIFKTFGDILEFFDMHGISYYKLCKNWRNDPLIYIERGSDILITAGAHGDEFGGVEAAVLFSLEPTTFSIVPVRDPAGVYSFIENIRFLTDFSGEVRDFGDVVAIIKEHSDWFYEDRDLGLYVGVFWDIAVCVGEIRGDWLGEDDINERLSNLIKRNESIRDKLEGMRVLIPASLPKCDGVGLFGRTFTSYIFGGEVLNYNRVFHLDDSDLPQEVRCLKNLLSNVKPKIVLDLHEGYGDKFYQFFPLPSDPILLDKEVRLLRILFEGVELADLEILKVKEAKDFMPKDREFFFRKPDDYVAIPIVDEVGKSLSSFALNKLGAISSTLETGLRAPLKKRVKMHISALKNLSQNVGELLKNE